MTQRVNPKCKLWTLIVMKQYWFIDCNKCATLMQDAKNRGNSLIKGGGRG